jgi:hypothetical protein
MTMKPKPRVGKDGVPRCAPHCPHWRKPSGALGARCGVTGEAKWSSSTDIDFVCEPAVIDMAKRLAVVEQHGFPATCGCGACEARREAMG